MFVGLICHKESTLYELRDYQQMAHDATIEHCKKSKDPVFHNMSVGAGKSLSIAYISKHISNKGGRVLILSRQAEIIEQNSEEAWSIGLKNSVFSASLDKKSTYYPVVFGTEGTVQRSLDTVFKNISFSALLIDEVHMVSTLDCLLDNPETQYGKIIKHFKSLNENIRIIGYTGSPYRGKDSILGEFWVRQLSNVSTFELINKGFLVPPVFGFSDDDHSYDLSAFTKSDEHEDYTQKELQAMGRAITKEQSKTQAIIEEVIERTKNRLGVMITCASKKHCEQVAECLPDGTWGIITDSTTAKNRRDILNKVKSGDLRYIIQIGCLTTGFNAPVLDTSVILRKIGSLTLLIQLVGRVLRTLKPHQIDSGLVKNDALILDYTSTFESMGDIFDDPIVSQAVAAKSKDEGKTPLECPACSTFNSEYAVRCCGTDLNSIDGRCEYFFKYNECKSCGAKNAPTSKSCRNCNTVMIDPNAALVNKAYTEADYKPVKNMTFDQTKTGKLKITYELDSTYFKNGEEFPEFAVEMFAIGGDIQPHERARWFKFIDQHINGREFKRRAAAFIGVQDVITMKAMFDKPAEITHRKNDKGFSIISRKKFNSGREAFSS